MRKSKPNMPAPPEHKWGGVTPYSRLRSALFALFLVGILAYGAGFAWYMLARFDLVNLIRDINGDDAFYYFQIAYNLASGKFSTFDGGITQTNGYHPIWMLLITPFYWVFDKEGALFGIKAFEIMLIAGGAALVVVAAWLARLPWILLFATLPLLYQRSGLFHGLEAAAALFMLGLFFFAAMLYARNPGRWKWPLAAAAFSLPWVRLEYVAISLAVTAALGLIWWSRRESPSPQPSPFEGEGAASFSSRESPSPQSSPAEGDGESRSRVEGEGLGAPGMARALSGLKDVVPLLGAVGGILVYLAYNGIVFGGVTPVSGAIKQMWSQQLWEEEGGYSFVQNFRDVLQIPVFDYELLVALEVCAYVVLIWWLVRRSRRRDDWLTLAFFVCVFGLAVGHLAKFAQTVLTIHPVFGGYVWYFVPAYLMMALIIPVRCYIAIHFIRRFIGSRWPWAANVLSVGIVVVGAYFLLANADFMGPFRYADWEIESTYREWEVTSHMGVQVMDRALPDGSVVGSWSAGVIGYFSRFPVVNLDGLVNSYDYARREGSGATFHRRYGITHFADVWRVIQGVDAMLFEGPPYHHSPHGELQFKLWLAEPPETSSGGIDRSDWFWRRMEAHFDSRSDGIGLIVDGRMAQAFARDCAPDELAVWSWTGAADEPVAKAWTQTQTGLCVDARVLPHDALPPVQVEAMTANGYLARLIRDSEPVIRSDWDVHLRENTLTYVKEPCARADTEAMFFLHLYPVDVNDLPDHRKQHGFDNLDFRFDMRGVILDGRCMATVALPEYDIDRISTGQYVPANGGFDHIWEGEIRLAE